MAQAQRRRGARAVAGAAAAVVFGAVLVCPASARADTVFTPFVGKSYGESDTTRPTTLGVSIASMAGGLFGFETDFARIADVPVDGSVFAGNTRVTTVLGSVIVALPGGRVRPYFVVGGGWLRLEAAEEKTDGIAIGGGGGLMGFISEHVGVRVEARYLLGATLDDDFDFRELTKLEFDDLAFWRTSVGLALRF